MNAEQILQKHCAEAIDRDGAWLFSEQGARLVLHDCKAAAVHLVGLEFFTVQMAPVVWVGEMACCDPELAMVELVESADFSALSAAEALAQAETLLNQMCPGGNCEVVVEFVFSA